MRVGIWIISFILLSLSTIANCMALPMNLRMLDTSLEIAAADEKGYSFSDEYFRNIGFMNLY
ncbi:unnamed protein product [Callosobruchus maculatus]|uniref:Uncharacterized protein n=1 Tax=Callosobruchus maculatus TaxID=64391 RepID=A0A653BJD3_CALMS|nr:unnamed protein product [Callosobruchus maculatus]